MACSNCYNGCKEVVSDKCVQYTGIAVPALDIKKGDSLSWVEQALVTFLMSTLDGSGIKITLEEEDYCELVSQYLQECQAVTALDLFKALVKTACDLQQQIDSVVSDVATIEADYVIECLEDVAINDGTHAIVQAVITKLCEINTALTALALDVETNYVQLSELNELIQEYLDSQAGATRYYTRMIPYTVVEYYGSLSFFDATGAGLPDTEWEDIYLCNGQNNTPDKRGRVGVGAIVGVPGGALSSAVNPASDPTFNPNYAVGGTAGANKVTLAISQIPAHAHGVTDPQHYHQTFVNQLVTSQSSITSTSFMARELNDSDDANDYKISPSTSGTPSVGKGGSSSTGISIQNTGSGAAHDNKQPVLACYYIMYIPS